MNTRFDIAWLRLLLVITGNQEIYALPLLVSSTVVTRVVRPLVHCIIRSDSLSVIVLIVVLIVDPRIVL